MAEIKTAQKLRTEDVANRISFRINTASRLIQQMSRAALKSLNLTQAQWRALMGVCTQPGQSGMTLQALTNFAQISQPLMSQAVKSLEERHLVTRSSPAKDRRVSVIVATPEGVLLGEQAYISVMQVEEQLIKSIGGNESDALNALLDKLIAGCTQT